MEFLDDLEMYEQSMQNAYDLITKKHTLDDVYDDFEENGISKFFLPFDPIEEDGRTEDVIDMVIEHFSHYEEYEKCAELVKIKKECLDKQIE